MRAGYTLLAGFSVQAAASIWSYNAKPYDTPAYANNECNAQQKNGFDWSDLQDGATNFQYNDFDFSKGWKCTNNYVPPTNDYGGSNDYGSSNGYGNSNQNGGANKYGGGSNNYAGSNGHGHGHHKRHKHAARAYGKKAITNKCSKKSPATFSSEKKSHGFSISTIHLSSEYDAPIDLHYTMLDGSICKQVGIPSKKSGYTVRNTQCGGAKKVDVYLGQGYKGNRDNCEIGVHNIGFDCNPPKPYSPPKLPSYGPTGGYEQYAPAPPVSSKVIQSTPPVSSAVNCDAGFAYDGKGCTPTSSAAYYDEPPVPAPDCNYGYGVEGCTPTTSIYYTPDPPMCFERGYGEGCGATSSTVVESSTTPLAYPPVCYGGYGEGCGETTSIAYEQPTPPVVSIDCGYGSEYGEYGCAPSPAPTPAPELTPTPTPTPSPTPSPTPESSIAATSTNCAERYAYGYGQGCTPTPAPASSSPVPSSSAAAAAECEYGGYGEGCASSSFVSMTPYKNSTVKSTFSKIPSSVAVSSKVPSSAAVSSNLPSSAAISSILASSAAASSSTYSTSTSASSSQAPTATYPPIKEVPEVLPTCMNTWLQVLTTCKSNTDTECYCRNPNFTKSVTDCVQAYSKTDEETKDNLRYLVGICAKHVPENPRLISDCPKDAFNTPVIPTGGNGTVPNALVNLPADKQSFVTSATPVAETPASGTPAANNPASSVAPVSKAPDNPVAIIYYGSSAIAVPAVHFSTASPSAGATPSAPVAIVYGAPPKVSAAVTPKAAGASGSPGQSGVKPDVAASGTGAAKPPGNGTKPSGLSQFTGAAAPFRVDLAHIVLGAAVFLFAL